MNKNFCYAPWTNLFIDTLGNFKPCCWYDNENNKDLPNLRTDDINNYKKSEFLNNIKQEFLIGNMPDGCKACKNLEESNIKSKRILDYELFKEHYDVYNIDSEKFLTVHVEFGRTCNLKCIMCSSKYSSRWHTEDKEIYGVDIKSYEFYDDTFIDQLFSHSKEIIHLHVTGGEPFLSAVDEQKKFLKHLIDIKRSSQITIRYNTNVTVFPDDEWWDLWQHFKQVEIMASIDGIKERFEYIRYPAKWQECEHNAILFKEKEKQYNNFKLNIEFIANVYNLFYINEFFQWATDIGVNHPHIGIVNDPIELNPGVLPDFIKVPAIKKLLSSEFVDVRQFAKIVYNTDNSQEFDNFLHRTTVHDNYRNLNFAKVFPELAEMIENYKKSIIIKA